MKSYLLLITLLFPTLVFSIDFEDAVFPELATSSRALAMGNAFIAKVDDASAVFYNPAGLGTIRYPHLHLSNFHLEVNSGMISASTGGSVTNATSNIAKMFSLDGTRGVLKNHLGSIAHSRVHALPNFTSRYFSVGYLFAKRSRSVATDTTSLTGFEYADRLDQGPYAALNISLFGGILKAGMSAIYLSRKELIGAASSTATLSISDSSYKKGNIFLSTAGGRITLPFVFLPTFAATLHNAFYQDFRNGSGAGAPDRIKPSLDLGVSITPQIGTNTRIHLELNYKDFGNIYSSVAMTRKILLGAELDFARVFFFRLGYGDGFGSAGLGVKSRKLEFDLTTYAVDTSSASFRGHEDRRFALGLSSGF